MQWPDIWRFEAEREKVADELAHLESGAAAVMAGLESGELALEEKRIALLEEEKLLSLAQEDLYRGKGEIQAAENRLEFQRKELLDLDRQKERLSDELANLQRQLRDAITRADDPGGPERTVRSGIGRRGRFT